MNLTHSQAVTRLQAIEGELETIAEKDHPSRSENLRAAALAVESDELDQHIKALERAHDIAHDRGGPKIRAVGEGDGINPYRDAVDDHRDGLLRGLRDKAMRTLDRHVEKGS